MMYLCKRILPLSLLLGAILLLCSCMSNGQTNPQPNEDTVTLVYYTIGDPDEDLALVNEELNRLLLQKINVQVEYKKIPWGEYHDQLSTLIASGGRFDVAFAAASTQGDFAGNAHKGAWLCLDGYLEGRGKALADAIDPLFWEGVTIDGSIFGVPTNKEIAVPEHFMYAEELVNDYQIDISQYRTFETLEPLLALVQGNEAEYIPLEFDSDQRNLFAIDGYEFVAGSQLPFMVQSMDPGLEVVNIFETDYAAQLLRTLHGYYQKGYINADAPIRVGGTLRKGEKVFCRMASGGPCSALSWSNDRGYPVVTQQVSPSVITTDSVTGGMMVVHSKTGHPEACVDFLTCLNTDEEVRNLLQFGMEGVHYQLTEQGQVHKISDRYAGIAYTQGNWFLLKTTEGDPLDKWDQFKAFNQTAVRSELLGFSPDYSRISAQFDAVSAVCKQFCPALMTGSVDIDQYLPLFLEELKAAGADAMQEELQAQIDDWKSKNR